MLPSLAKKVFPLSLILHEEMIAVSIFIQIDLCIYCFHYTAPKSTFILALNCPRCEIGQPNCSDLQCPECSMDFIQIESMDNTYAAACLGQNVLNQLPSTDETHILTEAYGAFPYKKLNLAKLSNGRK